MPQVYSYIPTLCFLSRDVAEEFNPSEVKKTVSMSERLLQNIRYYPFQNYVKVYCSTSHQFPRNWKPHPLQQELRRERL